MSQTLSVSEATEIVNDNQEYTRFSWSKQKVNWMSKPPVLLKVNLK